MANRRDFFRAAAQVGGAAIAAHVPLAAHAQEGGKEVSATEDLMREHGVLRRALLIYEAAAERLLQERGPVPATVLARTGKLFRSFGEDYHERRLEEKIIFPAVRKLKGPVARYPDVLEKQHDRGRALTDYVIETTRRGRIDPLSAKPLGRALHDFVLMYAHHAAREDTEVFTAWKDSLSASAFKEMGEQFEHIERQVFGHDGFEDAVRHIAELEGEMGLSNLAAFTVDVPSMPKGRSGPT
jgi:hemerythrin-like domain-containing protein